MNSASLFRNALEHETAFDRLAPALRRHYDLVPGASIIIAGVMRTWTRFPALRRVIPLMPRNDPAARVTVRNRGLVASNGDTCFEWDREFRYADGSVQRTHTLTVPAPAGTVGHAVMDIFRVPAPIGIVMALLVSADGRMLTQTAGGQYALLSRRRLPLPFFARLRVQAEERAVSDEAIHTRVEIGHALLGPMFGYEGELIIVSAGAGVA